MQRKLRGSDIPAATEASLLHAAAFLEFKQHVAKSSWKTPETVFVHLLCGEQSSSGTLAAGHIVLSCAV